MLQHFCSCSLHRLQLMFGGVLLAYSGLLSEEIFETFVIRRFSCSVLHEDASVTKNSDNTIVRLER